MLESFFRPSYQTLLVDPVAIRISTLHPVGISCAALIFGVAAASLLSMGYVACPLLLLLASGYLDTLDGTVARLQQRASAHGAMVDIVGDRIVEFSIIMGLYFIDPQLRALPCLAMLGSVLLCVTSFLVVAIFSENIGVKSFHYSPGIIERFEAFLFFIALICFVDYFALLSWTFVFLTTLTSVIRIFQFMKSATVGH